jgi:archaeal cell division control protein 6
MNVFRSMDSGEPLFRNEKALQPDFLPEEVVHREREIRDLAFCLKPASGGKQPQNVVIMGPPGTGKTTCAKSVLRQLSEYSQAPLPVYINCWETPTRFGILNAILGELGEMMPRRGIAADEIMSRLFSFAKNLRRVPVVVLDEADRLFSTEYGNEQVLYDLARASEVHSVPLGIIAITNDTEILAKVDGRIRSSLAQKVVEFAQYSPTQLKDILSERAKIAFFPGALDDEVIGVCAAVGAKEGGDARLAITLLWMAGREAERQGARKVALLHVKKVKEESIEKARGLYARKEETLEGVEQEIVNLLKKSSLESGELYAKLKMPERTVRYHLERLEKMGIITSDETATKDGRKRKISLKKS